jgi:predicted neuraminidase
MLVLMVGGAMVMTAGAQEPYYEAEYIFDPGAEDHGHVHASCIVECPNGDLLAVWYENGEPLPAPYYQGDRDKSDDVRIGGARKPAGADTWNTPFVMADTFGCSDNNPCMVIDAEHRLWLVYPTLIGVPQNTWGSALVRFKVSSDYGNAGPPPWDREGILVPKVTGFAEVIAGPDASPERLARAETRLKDPLTLRLGWMPRAHPLVRSDGTVIIPLSNENFGIAAMAMTNDAGVSWTMSSPVPNRRITQPTLVEYPDGAITAFFRNSWPGHRIRRSDSKDGGMTWSPLEVTDLLHPGAGIEAIVLRNGHLVMIYNDKEESPRDRLAVSISTDRGKTWQWTRHLENTPGGRFDYPSIVESPDGTMHASYSYNLETIKHVHFNEAWVHAGDS